MRETIKKTLIYTTVLGAVFALVYFVVGGNILGLFTDSAEIVAIGTPFLRIGVISFLAYGTMYMTLTLFQSTGHASPSFAISLIQETVVVPLVLLGTALIGVQGIAWAIPAGDVTAMLIGLILQMAYRKKFYPND